MDKQKHSRASRKELSEGHRDQRERVRRQQEEQRGVRVQMEEQRQRAHMKTTVKQLPQLRRNLRKDAYAKDTGRSAELTLRDRLLLDDDRQPDPLGIATVLIDAAGFGDEDVPIDRRAEICKAACTHAGWLSYGRLTALKNYLGLRDDQPLQDSMAWKRCNDPAYVAKDLDDWLSEVGHKQQYDDSEGDFVNKMKEGEPDNIWDDPDWE